MPGRLTRADGLERLRRDYTPLFLRYLSVQDETGLQSAYELGREALSHSLGLLEVIRVHNDTYLGVMETARELGDAQHVARAASELLLELIAAYEMTQRGFMDVGLRRQRSRAGEE